MAGRPVVLIAHHAAGSTQFLSRDPMVRTTRSPYGYVGGNPLNGTDPSGLDCGWSFWDCPGQFAGWGQHEVECKVRMGGCPVVARAETSGMAYIARAAMAQLADDVAKTPSSVAYSCGTASLLPPELSACAAIAGSLALFQDLVSGDPSGASLDAPATMTSLIATVEDLPQFWVLGWAEWIADFVARVHSPGVGEYVRNAVCNTRQ